MARFFVTGGDFHRSEGSISIIELENNKLRLISENWLEHPIPSEAVLGKGLTGMYFDDDIFLVAFSNLIAEINPNTLEILRTWSDPLFNDIHGIHRVENEVFVSNCGNESVDILNISNGVVERINLLGDDLRSIRPPTNPISDTKPHLHHISDIIKTKKKQILISLVRQGRIFNLSEWKWIGPRFSSPPHDLISGIDDTIWLTTVDGGVHRICPEGKTKSWLLKNYQQYIGWTRGLAITNAGFLVGTTAIRSSNSDYFQSFISSSISNVEACLTWIPINSDEESFTLSLPSGSSRKIFSIVQYCS